MMRINRIVWTSIVLFSALAVAEARTTPAEKKGEAAADQGPQAFILVDAASGRVLDEKDSHRPWPPASMTKMMLMLIVAERVRDGELKWDQPIRASRWASQMGGSQVYLKDGEEFRLDEMMQAIIIHSANDATVAVAESVAGSSDAFVDLMNDRAEQLGMKDTRYQTPHGLPPAAGQTADLSSAYDLAILARALLEHPDIMKWAGTAEAPFRGGEFKLTNTNHLVRNTNWVDGLKTGYYREAGFNVTATGQRNGLRLVAVILGVPQKKRCFDEAAKLLNQGFSQFKSDYAVKKGDVVANDVPVKAGNPKFVRIVAGADLPVLTDRKAKRAFVVELSLPGELQAPLQQHAKVGEVIVKENDAEVGRVPAVAADSIERAPTLWERWF